MSFVIEFINYHLSLVTGWPCFINLALKMSVICNEMMVSEKRHVKIIFMLDYCDVLFNLI